MRIRLALVIFMLVVLIIPFESIGKSNAVQTVNYKSELDGICTKDNENLDEDIVVINLILDDWETYRKTQYTPIIDETMMISSTSEEEFSKTLSALLNVDELHPLFIETLMKLNPYRTLTGIYKSDFDVAYGITQINIKLIPLATLYYADFETNPKSQLRFLNDYITIKASKGQGVDSIVKQYKYCLYN